MFGDWKRAHSSMGQYARALLSSWDGAKDHLGWSWFTSHWDTSKSVREQQSQEPVRFASFGPGNQLLSTSRTFSSSLSYQYPVSVLFKVCHQKKKKGRNWTYISQVLMWRTQMVADGVILCALFLQLPVAVLSLVPFLWFPFKLFI